MISPNRKNFAPWEKLPAGNGVSYLEKYEGAGIDPMYLAMMSYEDHDALRLVIETFGLVPQDEGNRVSTFTNTLGDRTPEWFSPELATEIYVFPAGFKEGYVSNLWINTNNRTMILERTWW